MLTVLIPLYCIVFYFLANINCLTGNVKVQYVRTHIVLIDRMRTLSFILYVTLSPLMNTILARVFISIGVHSHSFHCTDCHCQLRSCFLLAQCWNQTTKRANKRQHSIHFLYDIANLYWLLFALKCMTEHFYTASSIMNVQSTKMVDHPSASSPNADADVDVDDDDDDRDRNQCICLCICCVCVCRRH